MKRLEKYHSLSNKALLAAYQDKHDAYAFLELFRRYEGKLQTFIDKGITNKADARDLVQSTYIGLLESRAFKTKSIQDFEKFLFKLAYYKRCEYYRRKSKPSFELLKPRELREMEALTFLSDTSAFQKEMQLTQLQQAIQHLPAAQQKATELQLQGMKYEEIASVMGITASNVGTLINRAKQRLRNTLNPKR